MCLRRIVLWVLCLGLVSGCNRAEQGVSTPSFGGSKIKVALFNGNGASAVCVLETYESLKIDMGIVVDYISASQISEGKLSDHDVIIFPGGSGSKEFNNLGDKASAEVIKFVNRGKGAVGICAGGYLFSTTRGYPSLKLISATEWDREHYNKGRALIEFEPSTIGLEMFPELEGEKCYMQYYDGPVFMPSDSGRSGLMQYEELARFVTDIKIHSSYPNGITPGKTFLLREHIGEGRAIVVSGHPESTPGMRWMVPRMVRWAANKPMIEYHKKWVRPELYSHEILYYKNLVSREKALFWDLLSDDVDRKIDAMEELWELHSRPAVRWNIGMLRDSSSKVRESAAMLLQNAEYSAAIPDLQAAYNIENSPETKLVIKEVINHLSNDYKSSK